MEELRAARTQVTIQRCFSWITPAKHVTCRSLLQVKELKRTVQELVSTKAAVEQAVRGVLADNEALTQQVRDLTDQVQQLKAANRA